MTTDDLHSNALTAQGPDLVKIFFTLDAEAPFGTESMWAKPLGDGVFLVDNTPFYAYGVSCGDKVYAQRAADGALEFSGVAEHGGHSTYRVVLRGGVSADGADGLWRALASLGCEREIGPGGLWAIDLPPHTDIYRAYDLLERGEGEQVWVFEEAHVGHRLRA